MDSLSLFHDWYSAHYDQLIKDFFRFLSFQTVSADKAYHHTFNECIKWMKAYLPGSITAELWETEGRPTLYFSTPKVENAPTVLVYHHYDVQPPGEVEDWNTPPFEPSIREGAVFARGAVDNKGQCFYSLCALKAFLELQDCPINIKYIIEGEEEVGSPSLAAIAKTKQQQLQADYLLVVDGGILAPDRPAVVVGIKGIATLEVECTTAESDIHSGMGGGVAANAVRVLSHLLNKCWAPNGSIAIPGFYENIKSFSTKDDRLAWTVDLETEFRALGVHAFVKEEGFSAVEANWIRPTLEINGFWGGYLGKGSKTIIPAKAYAKLSMRLVDGQSPEEAVKAVKAFLQAIAPEGVHLQFKSGGMGRAVSTSPNAPIVHVVRQAYQETFQTPCELTMMGGSVPVVSVLQEVSKAAMVVMGMGLPTDCIHAPNEHFSLDRFKKGFLVMARVFQLLSAEAK